MALVLLTELNMITFGAMLLVYMSSKHQKVIVHVQVSRLEHPQHSLEIITTVNQEIQIILGDHQHFIKMIHYGMASNVKLKVTAAMVPTLLHGSVYSSLLQQLK